MPEIKGRVGSPPSHMGSGKLHPQEAVWLFKFFFQSELFNAI